MDVSVVICAYTEERWDTLTEAARAAAGGTLTPREVIVVCDHAPELEARVRAELPEVLAMANNGPRGLSGARNAGLAASRGEVVAFLDDDALPAADWLERLVAAYADPAVVGVGGAAEPLFPGERPAFLAPEFDWVVGCTYRGLPEDPRPVRNLIGANMSFRREALLRAGGFVNGIGRVGTRPVGCEETELCIRLAQGQPGAVLLYDPAVAVRHVVTPERTTLRYYVRRCWAEGRSKALVAARVGRSDALANERRHALRTLPRALRAALGSADAAGAARAVAIVTGLAITTAGYLAGAAISKEGRA